MYAILSNKVFQIAAAATTTAIAGGVGYYMYRRNKNKKVAKAIAIIKDDCTARTLANSAAAIDDACKFRSEAEAMIKRNITDTNQHISKMLVTVDEINAKLNDALSDDRVATFAKHGTLTPPADVEQPAAVAKQTEEVVQPSDIPVVHINPTSPAQPAAELPSTTVMQQAIHNANVGNRGGKSRR